MKRGPDPSAASIVIRMKRLPRRHRLAHLRALIRRQRAGASRREQLLALLGDEMAAQPSHGSRAR
jgi:hypothetical protein